ncbi:MAG: 4-(cytidine 5'-diphospho)-2-C-methyl-D-erythritol kinase [Candidatus Rokubacteria bacterium]|nr:4-(cytidine 5'-diphospho)-2-C-methyl-D-erythritol kinase [Candidatus Rokubacteria bacterium]
MRRLVVNASAKVNLTLEVLGKRPDGYHEIATVMQAVDLSDQVVLEDARSLMLETDAAGVPTGADNLVMRAAALLREAAGVDRGARIRLAKRIPVAAGLGGGSSDAAATLWGLNRLWGVRWGGERLSELAVRLGMDVPFFLGRGRALATGRGERIERLPGGGAYALVLVNPNIALPAREVYGRVTEAVFSDGSRVPAMLKALERRNAAVVAASLYNGLETVVEPAWPVVGRIKAALASAGALGAVMSGSGPTVVVVARSLDHARQIRTRVARASWSCWSVRTVSGPAVRLAG